MTSLLPAEWRCDTRARMVRSWPRKSASIQSVAPPAQETVRPFVRRERVRSARVIGESNRICPNGRMPLRSDSKLFFYIIRCANRVASARVRSARLPHQAAERGHENNSMVA